MTAPAIIRRKRDTAALWTSNNPTLAAGQIGIETDTLKFKFGNGTSTWTQLPYVPGTTPTNADGTPVDFKDSVQLVTTANITLSGEQTIDGVLTAASRVLVNAQNTGSQNGIYVSAAGAWSRATDADADSEVTCGMLVVVEEGTVGEGLIYKLATANPITVGTTALSFVTDVPPSFFFTGQSAGGTSYTLKMGDSGKRRSWTAAGLVTITIPTHASVKFPVNTEIEIGALGAAGVLVTGPSGGTLNSISGGYIPKGYVGKLKKRANNTWDMTGIPAMQTIAFMCGDLSTALAAGTTKGYAINDSPTPFIVREVAASLVTAQASGSIFTVDINEGSGTGTSILSTKLTIDNTETVGGSNAAAGSATPAVISDASIAAYGRITADIDQIGNGSAVGLAVYVRGYPSIA